MKGNTVRTDYVIPVNTTGNRRIYGYPTWAVSEMPYVAIRVNPNPDSGTCVDIITKGVA